MRTFTLVLTLLGFAHLANAAPAQPPLLELQDAYAEPAEAGGTSRISARLVNPTSQTITVLGIGSTLATQSKLLTYGKDAQGFTHITESDQLLIPPGETLLIPNVLELRLIGLTAPLTPGNEIPLGFTFANKTHRIFKAFIKE